MLTPIFGRVKGETEAALLAMMKTYPSLRPYSVRPAGVDMKDHPEIHEQVNARNVPLQLRLTKTILFPFVRNFLPGVISPTRDLGRVMTELATGSGDSLEGSGVSGEGRTLNNKGFRRMAGL